MTRRDAALLLVAAAVIFALILVGRSQRSAYCRRDGCFVIESETAWRESIDVDYA
jgi:hypothetical protein